MASIRRVLLLTCVLDTLLFFSSTFFISETSTVSQWLFSPDMFDAKPLLPSPTNIKIVIDDYSHLPPCNVAIINSVNFHLETLESVPYQYPLHALSMSSKDPTLLGCNPRHWIVDFHIWNVGPRAASWVKYFRKQIQQQNQTNRVSPKPSSNGVRIEWGKLDFETKKPPLLEVIKPQRTGKEYQAIIEASCYCPSKRDKKNYVDWLQQDERHSCVTHKHCQAFLDHPRVVWVSPHHETYYMPLNLPAPPTNLTKSSSPPYTLCVAGGTDRREWSFVAQHLKKQVSNASSIAAKWHLLGYGKFPKELQVYRLKKLVFEFTIPGFEEYFRAVSLCHGMIIPMGPQKFPGYFGKKRGGFTLSGNIPLIVRYRLPSVLHEEMYTLYQRHLDDMADVPHATYNDVPSFVQATDRLLQQIHEKQSGLKPVLSPDTASTAYSANSAVVASSAANATAVSKATSQQCSVHFRDPNMALCYYLPNLNFGDELGPIIARKLLETHFANCTAEKVALKELASTRLQAPTKHSFSCLMTIGSILHMSKAGDHIWGTGINPTHQRAIPGNMKIYGVRGPKTKQFIRLKRADILANGTNQIGFGDPGFITPFLFPQYQRERQQTPDADHICLVPHYHDLPAINESNISGLVEVITPRARWQDVLSKLSKCDYVGSSSLHGVILAEAIGIPTIWVQLPGSKTQQTEGNFKYQDYILTTLDTVPTEPGAEEMAHPRMRPVGDLKQILNVKNYPPVLSDAVRSRLFQSVQASFPYHLFQSSPVVGKTTTS